MNISTIISIALFITCLFIFFKYSNVEGYDNNKKNLVILGSVSLQNNAENKYIYDQIKYFVNNPPNNYHIISTNSTSGVIGYILDNLKNKKNVTTYTSNKLIIPLNRDYKIKYYKTDDRFENQLIDEGDVYLVLPGGIGSLFELTFIIFHIIEEGVDKKLYILNTDGYYDLILQHIQLLHKTSALKGGAYDRYKKYVIVEDNMKAILDQLN